jgi:hypothetical protein
MEFTSVFPRIRDPHLLKDPGVRLLPLDPATCGDLGCEQRSDDRAERPADGIADVLTGPGRTVAPGMR